MDKKIGKMSAKPIAIPPDVDASLDKAPQGVRLTAAIASRFNFVPRMNTMRSSKWVIAVDKVTGKTFKIKDAGAKRASNATFPDSHSAIKFLMKHFELKGNHLVEVKRFTL